MEIDHRIDELFSVEFKVDIRPQKWVFPIRGYREKSLEKTFEVRFLPENGVYLIFCVREGQEKFLAVILAVESSHGRRTIDQA